MYYMYYYVLLCITCIIMYYMYYYVLLCIIMYYYVLHVLLCIIMYYYVLLCVIYNRHEGPVWQVSWAHPKYGSILASCSYDRKVSLLSGRYSITNCNTVYTTSCRLTTTGFTRC